MLEQWIVGGTKTDTSLDNGQQLAPRGHAPALLHACFVTTPKGCPEMHYRSFMCYQRFFAKEEVGGSVSQ